MNDWLAYTYGADHRWYSVPGIHALEPFEASITDTVCDVESGDIFFFDYDFSATTDCGWLDLRNNDVGLLIFEAPYLVQYIEQ